MDWTAIAALLTAAAAALKVFWPSKSQSVSTTKTTEQVVDGDVLAQFLGLTDRVADLELQVADLTLRLDEALASLEQALCELADMRKQEANLREQLGEKDEQITALREAAALKQDEIDRLRRRVAHLEALCRRHGLNGDTEHELV